MSETVRVFHVSPAANHDSIAKQGVLARELHSFDPRPDRVSVFLSMHEASEMGGYIVDHQAPTEEEMLWHGDHYDIWEAEVAADRIRPIGGGEGMLSVEGSIAPQDIVKCHEVGVEIYIGGKPQVRALKDSPAPAQPSADAGDLSMGH